MRICDINGCSKPHRARGLCSTHYNHAYQPDRHAKKLMACEVCGTEILRLVTRKYRRTCSVECRAFLEFGQGPSGAGYSWASTAAARARRFGATIVDYFDRSEVFERDSWICGICGEPTDAFASPFDPASATVDHIVPLSLGGEHSLVNAQCAHLGCNSAKQDAVGVGHG